MKTEEYFKTLSDEIHSVVIATTDENNLPKTRVIDIMLYDKTGLYFLTAKGKDFHKQLETTPYISLSGITSGLDSMEKKSITISGFIKNIGKEKLGEILQKNPYITDIYPTVESCKALDIFYIYKGKGEYFDLSKKPIVRKNFTFGGEVFKKSGFFITKKCKEQGECKIRCPQDCIEKGTPYKINQEHCLHCGNCYDFCPNNAVIKIG